MDDNSGSSILGNLQILNLLWMEEILHQLVANGN